jgi:hypothetical protein
VCSLRVLWGSCTATKNASSTSQISSMQRDEMIDRLQRRCKPISIAGGYMTVVFFLHLGQDQSAESSREEYDLLCYPYTRYRHIGH